MSDAGIRLELAVLLLVTAVGLLRIVGHWTLLVPPRGEYYELRGWTWRN